MDLITVLTLIGVAIANIGTTISLFLWATNHTEKARDQTLVLLQGMGKQIEGINRQVDAIQEEMKDFHGRLCALQEKKMSSK